MTKPLLPISRQRLRRRRKACSTRIYIRTHASFSSTPPAPPSSRWIRFYMVPSSLLKRTRTTYNASSRITLNSSYDSTQPCRSPRVTVNHSEINATVGGSFVWAYFCSGSGSFARLTLLSSLAVIGFVLFKFYAMNPRWDGYTSYAAPNNLPGVYSSVRCRITRASG